MTDIRWHALASDEVLAELGTSEEGLSGEEVVRRLNEVGGNLLEVQEQTGILKVLFRQFKSVLLIVLLFAGIVAVAAQQWPEAIAIAAVILVNVGIGFVSEYTALRAMDALRKLGQHRTRVRRGGELIEVEASQLVPGDIVELNAEALIPADLRLLSCKGVQINEAALTGESVPVTKVKEASEPAASIQDRHCIAYKGTSLETGKLKGVVVLTGMDTEVGKISSMTSKAKANSAPLQERLDSLGKRLAFLVGLVTVLVALAGYIRGRDLLVTIETAIALGVAALPEGLPIVASIALARGMWLMAKRQAVMNRLPAVESLGRTTVIFTDKTGTLTENKMSVERIVTEAGETDFNTLKDSFAHDQTDATRQAFRLLNISVLCNGATLAPKGSGERSKGDPMELALLQAGEAIGLERKDALERRAEVKREQFDSDTMMMATYHQDGEQLLVAVKGAPEAVISACTGEYTDEEESYQSIDQKKWFEISEQLSSQGLRVLAMAEKPVTSKEGSPYENLNLIGLLGFVDPPRTEVQDAIKQCQKAGIKVVMLTGDSPSTAKAIGKKVGIVCSDSNVIGPLSGGDLQEDLNAQKDELIDCSVFARVTPEQKLKLVSAFQANGEIVAMTGDGVNDAPALKKADVGIAMGKRGTDAAKQVADLVLKDDSFESIVVAVRYGRVIFDNIRKSVMFMLCTNAAEVLAVTAAFLFSIPIPLKPLQILYLNILTDVFPALALSVGDQAVDVMADPPRNKNEQVLNASNWKAVALWSFVIGASILFTLLFAQHFLNFNETAAVTCSFLTLGFTKLWFVFNLRHPRAGIFKNEITGNVWIWISIGFCILLLWASVYIPVLSKILQTESPSGAGWSLILIMSILPLIPGQLLLHFRSRSRRNSARKEPGQAKLKQRS